MTNQDIYLVAIAEGPGTGLPFWPIAKPYQPRSPDWTPRLIGATGAVWVDGDGKRDAAVNYAKSVLNLARGDMKKIVRLLAHMMKRLPQVAPLLWKEGTDLNDKGVVEALLQASPQTNADFEKILEEIRLLK